MYKEGGRGDEVELAVPVAVDPDEVMRNGSE